MRSRNLGKVLLIHNQKLTPYASTVMEHVNAFSQYSRYDILNVNTALGFPRSLERMKFDAIILHYSLFGWPIQNHLPEQYCEYILNSSCFKIAFFQDEYRFCQEQFKFINENKIDCVYTLFTPDTYSQIYLENTTAHHIVSTIPAYAMNSKVVSTNKWRNDLRRRPIEIGYRGKTLPFQLGEAAQLRQRIGRVFKIAAPKYGLKIDIDETGSNRIYGSKWIEFLSRCQGVLGTEAGASIVDLDGSISRETNRLLKNDPSLNFEEISQVFLSKWEGNLHYLTISARHFEAARTYSCQIMYEGDYSGIMRPMVDYLALKKDASNLDEIIQLFRKKGVCEEIASNAFDTLIGSGKYSYRNFIADFDERLEDIGIRANEHLVRLKNNQKVDFQTIEMKRIVSGQAWERRKRLSLLFKGWLKIKRAIKNLAYRLRKHSKSYDGKSKVLL